MGCCPSRVEDEDPPARSTNLSTSRASSPAFRAPPTGSSAAAPTSPPRRNNIALKKAKPWRSTSRTWSRAQLDRERSIFWETQVSGHKEVWAAIKLAVDMARDQGDLKGAKAVLDASGCTLESGRLNEGIWDERGNHYKLTRWVVSDPKNIVPDEDADDANDLADDADEYDDLDDTGIESKDGAQDEGTTQRTRDEKGKAHVPTGPNAVTIKARLSDRAADIELVVDIEAPIKRIIKRIHAEAGISSSTKLKLAYLGKVLKDNDSLKSTDWKPGDVVSVLVFA